MLSRFTKLTPAVNNVVAARAFAAEIKATGPRLDEHGEPRFLEQVKLHF
jgi:hypothetical protein